MGHEPQAVWQGEGVGKIAQGFLVSTFCPTSEWFSEAI